MRVRVLPLLIAATAALSACGSAAIPLQSGAKHPLTTSVGGCHLEAAVMSVPAVNGEVYRTLMLLNRSGSCTLKGYPQIQFLNGTFKVGSPSVAGAHDTGQATPTTQLVQPGQQLFATLTTPALSASDCTVNTVTALSVRLPGAAHSLTTPLHATLCTSPGMITGPLQSERGYTPTGRVS